MNRALTGLAAGLMAAGALVMAGAGEGDGKPAEAAKPIGMRVGEKAPNATLKTIKGESVTLASLLEKGPVVLTFYRGDWCPYCNKALKEWEPRLPEVASAGGTFVAVTLEKPSEIEKMHTKIGPEMIILGDPAGETAKAFNILFTVDDSTRTKYKGYGIDVGASNSDGQWTLPHPATFVIDRGGVIRYSFVNADYRFRANPDDVIAMLKSLPGEKQ